MSNVRDLLLAQFLGCNIEELAFLDSIDENDDRWGEVTEEINGGIRPGLSLVKKVFGKRLYLVTLNEYRTVEVEVEAEDEYEARTLAMNLAHIGEYSYTTDAEVEVISVEEE